VSSVPFRFALGCIGVWFGSSVVAAAEPAGVQWQFSTGAHYSTGSYGGDVDTDMLYVPATIRAQGEHLKFDLTVPYLRLTGPGNVVGGGGPIVIGPSPGTRTTHSGLGDVTASASYMLPRLGTAGPFLEPKVRVKLATAGEGLGTDKPDFAAQVTAYQLAGARLTLIGMLGYQQLGDPTGIELEDGLIGQLGFNLKAGAKGDLGLLYDYHDRSFVGVDNQQSLTPYLSWRNSDRLGMTLYGVFGLTDASPDYAAGLQITYYP
jgi:hypothetical protein